MPDPSKATVYRCLAELAAVAGGVAGDPGGVKTAAGADPFVGA